VRFRRRNVAQKKTTNIEMNIDNWSENLKGNLGVDGKIILK
jgi:hypothetical protein